MIEKAVSVSLRRLYNILILLLKFLLANSLPCSSFLFVLLLLFSLHVVLLSLFSNPILLPAAGEAHALLPNSCCEGPPTMLCFCGGSWVWRGVQVKFCAPNVFVQKVFIAVTFIPSTLHSFLHPLTPCLTDPFQPPFWKVIVPLVTLLFLWAQEMMRRVLVHVQANDILSWLFQRGCVCVYVCVRWEVISCLTHIEMKNVLKATNQ